MPYSDLAALAPDIVHVPDARGGVFAPGGSLYALSYRNFRLFFSGQLISVAGTWMQQVSQQWLVYDLTHSPVWLGIVSGATAVPYVLFAFWGGTIADRLPRRTILLRTQTIAMCLAFSLAVLASNRVVRMEPWHLAVFAALGAVVNAFNMPAQQAFVTQMVDDPKALPNAIALSSLRFNLARVLGPLLAGIALVKLGAAWCFALNGASYLAVLLSLSLMRIAPKAQGGRSGAAVSPWDGARFLVGIPALLRVTLLVATGALSVLAVSTLYPVLAGRFEGSASRFSTLVTVNGIGATLGGLFVVVFGGQVGLRPRIYGGAGLFCVALLATSFALTFPLLLTCLFFAGAGMVTFMVSANTKIQTDAPDELRGRVMAMHALIVNALIPVGGLLLGFAASRFPVQSTIRFAAAFMLSAVLAIWLWSSAGREKR